MLAARAAIKSKAKCNMKIVRALFFAHGFVSCTLLVGVTIACADASSEQIIGDAAHRTARSSQSKDNLAGGGPLHLYPSQQSKHKDVTEKPQRPKKRNFRSGT
jgi:hypothetical protein